jgi:hypothetical protein
MLEVNSLPYVNISPKSEFKFRKEIFIAKMYIIQKCILTKLHFVKGLKYIIK